MDDHVLQNAKLNLVDLAGSEKIQPTESGRVTGVMLQEPAGGHHRGIDNRE